METSDAIALGALGVSLIALGVSVWQALQNRPQLRVRVAAGMMVLNQYQHEGPFLVIAVTNYGTQPTTITGFGLQPYENRFAYWRRKGNSGALGVGGGHSSPLPHLLEPGREARFFMDQDSKLADYVLSSRIIAALVMHSWSEKPERRMLTATARQKIASRKMNGEGE